METERRERFTPTAETGAFRKSGTGAQGPGTVQSAAAGMLRTNWQIVCQHLFTLFNAFNLALRCALHG